MCEICIGTWALQYTTESIEMFAFTFLYDNRFTHATYYGYGYIEAME